MSCPYRHCGVTTSGTVTREGHCWCPECHAGPEDGFTASRIILADGTSPADLPPGTPMCASWYGRAGEYRPWHSNVPGCACGANAHHLPEQHGTHCPVRQHHDRHALLSLLTPPGSP